MDDKLYEAYFVNMTNYIVPVVNEGKQKWNIN
jgi:hypothetical protein